MTNLLYTVIFLFFTCAAWSQQIRTTSSGADTAAYQPKFTVTLLVGQPNYIAGADVIGSDQPFSALHGDFKRFSMGTGFCFRWYQNETFFLHARMMYSTRRYSLRDSSYSDPEIVSAPNWTTTTVRLYEIDNAYRMNNILIGIGGGHEGRYGKFVVRAGGEIDFISYADVFVQTETRNSILFSSESTTNGHYSSVEVHSFSDHTTSPGLRALGIVGHAALEYKLTPHFGIGATVYLGGFYCRVTDKTWRQEVSNSTTFSDSQGNSGQNGSSSVNQLRYSVRQFDFSPLNAQINFAYYFGK